MNVAIDGGCFSVRDDRLRLGIHRFSKNFLAALAKIDKENRYDIYTFKKLERDIQENLGGNFKNVVVKPTKGYFKLWLPFSFITKKYDLYLGLSQALPAFHPFRSIIFVYDLAFERYPKCFPDSYNRLSVLTKKAAQESDLVVVFSQQTLTDVIEVYRLSRDRVKLLKPGIDPIFEKKSIAETNNSLDRFKLPENFFLYVGAFKKIKNLPYLIKGFSEFIKKTEKDYYLVLAGSDFWQDSEIEKTITKEKIADRVLNLGFVTDNELVGLYNRAKAYVSASLFEGFGLPVLEAAKCGCLLVLSDIVAHKENGSSQAIYFDLDRVSSLVKAMETALEMKEQVRVELKKQLIKNTNGYSWKKFAEDFLDLVLTSLN